MKEFIEKLIEKLEETDFNDIQMIVREVLFKYGFPYESIVQDEVWDALDELSSNKFAIKIINQLAEEYNNGWIPCSERLPEYSDCYNVTVGVSNEMGYYECVKAFNYVKKQGEEGKWVVPKDLFSTYSVIAWQNTPAPYKEGE